MRTTMHNGRAKKDGTVFGIKHNDRNFDVDKADNIDKERMKDNVYWHYYEDENLTFEEVELKFYVENFSKILEATNENYIKNRHPERVKTMEEWKRVRQNAPEETHLQIGKMEEHVTREQLVSCYKDYDKWLRQWNQENGNLFTVLNTALHCDEAVEHIQTRRVWHYRDEAGELRIGQEKALKAAGFELPDPEKPEGRRNNRKIAFDKMCREKWLDICHEHGIKVEREPIPNGRHNREKEDVIREKYEQAIKETQRLQIINQDLEKQNKALREEILTAVKDRNRAVDNYNEFLQEYNNTVVKHNEMLDDLDAFEESKARAKDLSDVDVVRKNPIVGEPYVQVDAKDWDAAERMSKSYVGMETQLYRTRQENSSLREENARKDDRINQLIAEKEQESNKRRNLEIENNMLHQEKAGWTSFLKKLNLAEKWEAFRKEFMRGKSFKMEIKAGENER